MRSSKTFGQQRPVRVEDVAREAGVSPITVSRALSSPEKVREETREKVARAVAKTGYVVNTVASSLRSGQSVVISVFVSNLENQHLAGALQGLAETLAGSRYHLLMAHVTSSTAPPEEMLENVLPFRPAAVMFTELVQPESREALARLKIPVLELWDWTHPPIDMRVQVSEYEGGRLVGEHFGAIGRRRIAYVGRTGEGTEARLRGFADGLHAHGAEIALTVPAEMRRVGAGVEAMARIAAELPDCDAVFCGNDILAAGVMIGADARGIVIPDQMALCGYGDLDFAHHLNLPLTSVTISGRDLGRESGKLLLERLKTGSVRSPVVTLPVQLQVRASTVGHDHDAVQKIVRQA